MANVIINHHIVTNIVSEQGEMDVFIHFQKLYIKGKVTENVMNVLRLVPTWNEWETEYIVWMQTRASFVKIPSLSWQEIYQAMNVRYWGKRSRKSVEERLQKDIIALAETRDPVITRTLRLMLDRVR